MIEPWSEEEAVAAEKLFKKIENNNRAWFEERRVGQLPECYPLPQDVYEAHHRTFRGLASELAVFDEEGRVFLTKRPSKEESPAEPFPDYWHIPGARHIAGENNQEALKRLIEDEIGTPVTATLVEYSEYFQNYLIGLYVARTEASRLAVNEKRGWFALDALPEPMLAEHIPILHSLFEHRTT